MWTVCNNVGHFVILNRLLSLSTISWSNDSNLVLMHQWQKHLYTILKFRDFKVHVVFVDPAWESLI